MTQMDMKDMTVANMKNTVVTLTFSGWVIIMQEMIGTGGLEPLARAPAVVLRPHTAPQSHAKVRIIRQTIFDRISISCVIEMKFTVYFQDVVTNTSVMIRRRKRTGMTAKIMP